MQLEVGDHVTVRQISDISIERQKRYWSRDNLYVGADTIIKTPFLFMGVHMTVEALQRSEAVCRVYDTEVITTALRNRRCVLLPRKYLVRLNPSKELTCSRPMLASK